ncbi:hypothetical protein K488DRAFT_92492, partial [Vararia minispora EC-137]
MDTNPSLASDDTTQSAQPPSDKTQTAQEELKHLEPAAHTSSRPNGHALRPDAPVDAPDETPTPSPLTARPKDDGSDVDVAGDAQAHTPAPAEEPRKDEVLLHGSNGDARPLEPAATEPTLDADAPAPSPPTYLQPADAPALDSAPANIASPPPSAAAISFSPPAPRKDSLPATPASAASSLPPPTPPIKPVRPPFHASVDSTATAFSASQSTLSLPATRRSVTISRNGSAAGAGVSAVLITGALESIASSREAKRSPPLRDA